MYLYFDLKLSKTKISLKLIFVLFFYFILNHHHKVETKIIIKNISALKFKEEHSILKKGKTKLIRREQKKTKQNHQLAKRFIYIKN